MGDNALTIASAGQDIPASHHNELVQAFLQNMVPRNATRTAEDLAGSLGTSALRWLRAYAETYHIGTASANLTISEAVPGEIHIKNANGEIVKITTSGVEFWVDSVKKFSVGNSGIDWATQNTNSIPLDKVNGFVPFSHTVSFHIFNDTNNVTLATTPGPCLVFVELLSNLDFAGGAFVVRAENVVNSPTTFQAFTKIFEVDATTEIRSNPCVIQGGKQIRVLGSDYTARINLHIIRLT